MWLQKANKAKIRITTIEFNNTPQGIQQDAVEVLKNSINIPLSLDKNQGELISIFCGVELRF